MDDFAGPQDPIGTVRATDGLLAVRTYSPESDDLVWYILAIGADDYPANVEYQLPDWPIVYQPAQHEPNANLVG